MCTWRQRLLGGWAFALAFRQLAFDSLDVSNVAAASLPPRRPCPVGGALLGELLLHRTCFFTGSKLARQTLWHPLCHGCFSKCSPRVRGTVARSMRHGCSKRKTFVRLEWHEPEPPSETCDFATRNTSMSQNWRVSSAFSSVLHLAACMPKKQLVLVETRVVLDSVSKGRSGSRWFGLRHRGVIMLNSVKSLCSTEPITEDAKEANK